MKRRAISPFIATAILIVATVVIGGVFFNQVRDYVSASTRNPSLALVDYTISPDLKTFTLNIRNDGNINVNLARSVVKVNGTSYTCIPGNGTAGTLTFYGPGPKLSPGQVASIGYTFDNALNVTMNTGDVIYVTLVGDVISKTLSITM
jgi:FlaG/FlaF family flagellin (archaellin)